MTDCKHLTIIGKIEDGNQACVAPQTFAGPLPTLVYRCADCGELWTGGVYNIPARAAEPPHPSNEPVVTAEWISAMRKALHANPEALAALSELERRLTVKA